MIVYDYDREHRLGMPEAIFCEGKPQTSLSQLISEIGDKPLLLTRLSESQFDSFNSEQKSKLDYDSLSRTAVVNGSLDRRAGRVAIVTAGTTDLNVAAEAQRTLDFSGVENKLFADLGVAGLWRILEKIEEIREYPIVILVAGMDAALASVASGLSGSCLIGVPTSVGYGVSHGGETALNSMLASCGQGLLVCNIDNGFGAACGAIRILNQFT